VVIDNTIRQNLAWSKLKVICAGSMQFVCFGDGRPDVNARGYDVTEKKTWCHCYIWLNIVDRIGNYFSPSTMLFFLCLVSWETVLVCLI